MSYNSICLVQLPLSKNQPDGIYPPIGLLTLASKILKSGKLVTILDLNLKGFQDPDWIDSDSFYTDTCNLILENDADLVGFSSMAAESHIGIDLSKFLKKQAPETDIVMGGPHFSSIAASLIERYPTIDYVAKTEADTSLLNLMLRGKRSPTSQLVPGIMERTAFGIQFIEADTTDLKQLDFPAYELVELQEYYNANPSKTLLYEHARGCNLRCSFCYSPNHWGQGERRKTFPQIVQELKKLEALGARNVFFVSDNFLNNWRYAVNLADAIAKENISLNWNCYGTLAQVNEQVVTSLSAAGCFGIFIGVDAISAKQKKSFSKSYYKDWDNLASTLRLCLLHGIVPTCAVMLSPDFTEEEAEDVLQTALLISTYGCHLRLNHLAYYNGTQLTVEENPVLQYSEAQVRLLMNTHERVATNKYAKEEPSLFPFHQRYSSESAEQEILYINLTLRALNNLYPGTLMRYIFEYNGTLYPLTKQIAKECGHLYERDESSALSKIDELMSSSPYINQHGYLDSIREYEYTKRVKGRSFSKVITVINIHDEREYKFYDPKTICLPCKPEELTQPGRLRDFGSSRNYFLPQSNVKDRLLTLSKANLKLIQKIRNGTDNLEINHNLIGELERTGLLKRHFPKRSTPATPTTTGETV